MYEDEEEKNACLITTKGSEEVECITGDIMFGGWGRDNLPETVCDTVTFESIKKEAIYKVCECGKWKEEKEEVSATPIRSGSSYVYTWNFNKEGELNKVSEKTTKRVYMELCTTGIEIYVPKDLRESEPSSDNSKYEKCPEGGIRIPEEKATVLHGNYIPENSNNRKLTWTSSNTSISTLLYSNPNSDKGFSRASITGTKTGETTVTTKTTNDKTGTCKVTIWDGSVDSVGCVNKIVTNGEKFKITNSFEPYNATKTDFTYTSSNTSVATIDNGGNVTTKATGTVTITVTASNGKTGTCTVAINAQSSGGGSSGGGSNNSYCSKNSCYDICRCNGGDNSSCKSECARLEPDKNKICTKTVCITDVCERTIPNLIEKTESYSCNKNCRTHSYQSCALRAWGSCVYYETKTREVCDRGTCHRTVYEQDGWITQYYSCSTGCYCEKYGY